LIMETHYPFSLLCDCISTVSKRERITGLYVSGFPGPSDRSS
jgi:hypothetical protein